MLFIKILNENNNVETINVNQIVTMYGDTISLAMVKEQRPHGPTIRTNFKIGKEAIGMIEELIANGETGVHDITHLCIKDGYKEIFKKLGREV